MSLDGNPEKDAIETHLKALVGGRVLRNLPEELQLVRDNTTALIKPYIYLSFGSLYPSAEDRSIEGEAQQPHIMPITIECWATVKSAAEATAGAVRTLMIGWDMGIDNASEIAARGGGNFESKDASGRPTRFMESVVLVTTINLSTTAP